MYFLYVLMFTYTIQEKFPCWNFVIGKNSSIILSTRNNIVLGWSYLRGILLHAQLFCRLLRRGQKFAN